MATKTDNIINKHIVNCVVIKILSQLAWFSTECKIYKYTSSQIPIIDINSDFKYLYLLIDGSIGIGDKIIIKQTSRQDDIYMIERLKIEPYSFLGEIELPLTISDDLQFNGIKAQGAAWVTSDKLSKMIAFCINRDIKNAAGYISEYELILKEESATFITIPANRFNELWEIESFRNEICKDSFIKSKKYWLAQYTGINFVDESIKVRMVNALTEYYKNKCEDKSYGDSTKSKCEKIYNELTHPDSKKKSLKMLDKFIDAAFKIEVLYDHMSKFNKLVNNSMIILGSDLLMAMAELEKMNMKSNAETRMPLRICLNELGFDIDFYANKTATDELQLIDINTNDTKTKVLKVVKYSEVMDKDYIQLYRLRIKGAGKNQPIVKISKRQ